MQMTTNFSELCDQYSPRAIREAIVKDGSFKTFGIEQPKDLGIDMIRRTMNHVDEAFYTGGVVKEDGSYIKFNDILSTKDLTRFVETSVVNVIRSAIEPNLVIVPNLFTQFNIDGPIPSIRITSIGPVHIREIAEGSDYKETSFEMDEELQRIDIPIKKYGGIVRITEEAVEANLVDLMRMWLQKMGVSFAQHKEKTALQMINRFGKVVFDGANPGSSVIGAPTGRGIDGSQNGTFSLHDFFDMYAHLALRGFNADTLIMNPMAWKMFMTDPETREIIVRNGVLSTRQLPAGTYAPGWGTSFGGLGERHTATGESSIDPSGSTKIGVSAFTGALSTNHNLSMLGSTFNIPPSSALPGPLKIIVTPYAGFRAATTPTGAYTTDIYMADSSSCGVLVQKELPTMEEFNDPWKDIRVAKARERYGFGILEQGKAIAVAKNIVVGRNYVFDNVNSQTLIDLDATTATTT